MEPKYTDPEDAHLARLRAAVEPEPEKTEKSEKPKKKPKK